MPRKSKKRENRKISPQINQDFFSRFGLNRSYVSLVLGIFVVFVVGGLALLLLRGKEGFQNVSLKDILKGVDNTSQVEQPEKESLYTVRDGDDLWSISENFYKSGYNWVDIAEENSLQNPSIIEVGQILKIPQNVDVIQPLTGGGGMISIQESTYVVLEGDNLWDISVRAYADGYKWMEVARVNNIPNPDLISIGLRLKLPR